MGIKSSCKVLWKASNVTTRKLINITRETKKMNGCMNESNAVRIDSDVSNLAYILHRSSKCNNSDNTVLDVTKFLK